MSNVLPFARHDLARCRHYRINGHYNHFKPTRESNAISSRDEWPMDDYLPAPAPKSARVLAEHGNEIGMYAFSVIVGAALALLLVAGL